MRLPPSEKAWSWALLGVPRRRPSEGFSMDDVEEGPEGILEDFLEEPLKVRPGPPETFLPGEVPKTSETLGRPRTIVSLKIVPPQRLVLCEETCWSSGLLEEEHRVPKSERDAWDTSLPTALRRPNDQDE